MVNRKVFLHGLLLLFTLILLFASGCGSGGGSGSESTDGSTPPATPAPPPKVQIYGLSFSPYQGNQDPNQGVVVPAEQIEKRMKVVAPYTKWIRTFGCTRGLEHAGAIAHGLQLKIAMGAWMGKDPAANEAELQSLIDRAKAGVVDLAIVGSEVLYRGDLNPAALITYIQRFRAEVPNVPVATAEVYSELLAHPEVVAECDVLLSNYYPYWEGVDVNSAIAWLHARHQQVVAAAGAREVIVSETGWPSAGSQLDDAVPSTDNAAFYFKNFVSWAISENVNYFYFEAFDEPWKSIEGPQGPHWGLFSGDGSMKPGMQAVFDGETMENNWTCRDIPGGTGTPAIELTTVPAIGSSEDLRGQVWHVAPGDHGLAVYIKVLGGWWTKPFWNNPVTPINCDGSWVCDITTGGSDPEATDIAAFLIPLTYTPPAATWAGVLPAELYTNSLANIEVARD